MPERLDHVTIALNGGDVVISWETYPPYPGWPE